MAKRIINNQEETKMAKFIVEAPEPQKGQKVSSGGIRENGKLTSQYKNPVPYKEPPQLPTAVVQRQNTELIRKEQARARRNEAGMYILGIVWQELGEPLFRSELHKLRNVIISKLESPPSQNAQHISSPAPEIIDVETDEIDTIYDENKTIPFPNKKAI